MVIHRVMNKNMPAKMAPLSRQWTQDYDLADRILYD